MIHKKLLEFQKKNIVLEKTGENPHFKSKFVPLNEVLAKVKPVLNELGVVLIQQPSKDGLTTTLRDTEDDTEISCFMPYVEATTPQKLGSNNTYNRRYSLITLLGLEDEDEDGQIASTAKPGKVEAKPKMEKVGNTTLPTEDIGF